jgi:hypothetical protein
MEAESIPDKFVVQPGHISFLAQSVYINPILKRFLMNKVSGLQELGQVLWDQNHRSINFALKKELPFQIFIPKYLMLDFHYDPLQVYKSAACYQYQSDETPDWDSTLAFHYTELLKSCAIRKFDGYEDRIWGYPESLNKPKKESSD